MISPRPAPLFDGYLMVDWSAAAAPTKGRDSIWIAVARCGQKAKLENPPTRQAAMARVSEIMQAATRDGLRMLAGFDFPFGYPEGTARALTGQDNWQALWALLADRIEEGPENANNRFAVAAALNGAFAGTPVNAAPVEAILKACKVPAQLGGGIRDMATIESWLDKGLARVILGTVAVENPDLVREAAAAFPGHVAVGIDARNGRVATKGWATETDVMATDLAKSFEDAGVAAIIYTDINRDGAMGGPNVSATADLARAVSIPVIASGGVSSLDDLAALRDTGVIEGAISGRALYDGAIDLAAAMQMLKG